METLMEYFGGAYLINLPHREDRLRLAKKELANIGWELGSGKVHLYAARTFTDRAGFPSVGARGCFHSHFECLKDAIASGRRHALMIEDDIAITPSLARLSSEIVKQLEVDSWDFLYLGHELTGHIPRASSRTSEVTFIAPESEIQTTHFYAVNGRIFSRLLAHLEQVAEGTEGNQLFGPMPIDGAYNIFRRQNDDVRTLISSPKLGWQRPSRSDIAGVRFFDKLNSMHFLSAKLREWKYFFDRWRS
jgi:GR25 family glycosyltransferase involved in LPS biosynthesis